MGSSSSKVASRAASAAKRSYPSAASTTTPAAAPAQPQPPSTATAQSHPSVQTHPPSDYKSDIVELDARDPTFASSLSRAGRAQRVPQPPSPQSPTTFPQSSFPTSSRPPQLQQAPAGQQIFPPKQASNANNPALQIVAARERLARQWATEQEGIGRKGFEGRTLLSAKEIKEVLAMRDQGGMEDGDIEKRMRLKPGVMGKLGRGVVANVES